MGTRAQVETTGEIRTGVEAFIAANNLQIAFLAGILVDERRLWDTMLITS